jgi:VIT1/CCC1 family predicted Fe2+/Mn2+ transporter
MLAVFGRGHAARLIRAVRGLQDDRALGAIGRQLDDMFRGFTSEAERADVYRILLGGMRRAEPRAVGIHAGDVLGGFAVAVLITMMTVPIIVPFAFVENPMVAARLSNSVALVMLFILGHRWGHFTGAKPWRTGSAMVGVGIVLVGVTILLGG